ncbi:hypothetical protein AB0K40_11245 [Nonomuraea bangladeshensis]|uniref:MFS transporter n=1 Tax=Nonomuraea bangladeshensis TaxID=404385 RepID=A0ABV3H0J7_9ACTN
MAAGCYLAVDRALLIDVLPDKQAAGRDLGLGSMSFSFGQAIGPVVAGQLVALTGGYGVVRVFSRLTSVAAAAAVMPVKKVR